MTIDKATEQQMTEAIGRWEGKFSGSQTARLGREARQYSNWLFGVELALGRLGLDDLAQKAIAAQRDKRRMKLTAQAVAKIAPTTARFDVKDD